MAIFDLHHPWAFTFGILGNIISIFVYLAPLPTFIRIYKEKSTLGFQSLPYVVALFSAMLWLYYAFIKTDALLLISINSFGIIIETIYIFVFFLYASKKTRKDTAKLIASLNVGLFSLIFFITLFALESLKTRVVVVGWICVAISTSVFAAPLSIVFQVVRTKSVEFMPFTLSFTLTLSAIMWFGYGLLQKDMCIALPNILGFILGMLQMLLYGIYRNPKEQAAVVEKKVQEHVINIVPLATSEVHPIDSPKSGSDDEIVDTVKETMHEGCEEEEEDGKSKNSSRVSFAPEEREPSLDSRVNVQIDPPLLVMCAA